MFLMELYEKILHMTVFFIDCITDSVFVSIVPARSGNRTISRR